MNKKEAEQLIRQVIEQVKLGWKEHQLLQEALKTLADEQQNQNKKDDVKTTNK